MITYKGGNTEDIFNLLKDPKNYFINLIKNKMSSPKDFI